MTKKLTKKPEAAPVAPATGARRPRRAVAKHSSKASTATAKAAPVTQTDTEAIARLAYSYWEARGCTDGSPEEDWLRAEVELKAGA